MPPAATVHSAGGACSTATEGVADSAGGAGTVETWSGVGAQVRFVAGH